MSLKATKEQLVELLADDDTRVIALSGKWGTGKSYMWEEVRAASEKEKVKTALYASLFGLSSIEQVKFKLIQSAVPAMEANPGLWDGAKQLFSSGVKALEGFHKSFGALNDVGLLFAPAMLRERLIVLDDIERKHEKLDIDEVLGFIDEFTQRHNARFLVILNSDQLSRREAWDTLREKVVDEELRLTTTPAEAFAIASDLSPCSWKAQIAEAAAKCGLTNIRIILKVIRVVRRITGERPDLPDAVLSRVIPSAVLLAAIHYKGIENGPDFDFVLAAGTPKDWGHFLDKKAQEESEDDRRKAQWKLLVTGLGIYSSDDFELLIIEYLQSGLFDVSKLTPIIDRYVKEAEGMTARDACNRFFERSVWEHTLSDAQLLDEAKEIVARADLIDPYMASALYDTLMELPGGEALANEAVRLWVEAFKAENHKDATLGNYFNRKVHPLIEAVFKDTEALSQADTSVLDACSFIIENSGWGKRQEMALKLATADSMEVAIRQASPRDLRTIMAKMLEFTANKPNYEKNFGLAMDNFVEACRHITKEPASARLGKLIQVLFADAKLSPLLETPAPGNVAGGDGKQA